MFIRCGYRGRKLQKLRNHLKKRFLTRQQVLYSASFIELSF